MKVTSIFIVGVLRNPVWPLRNWAKVWPLRVKKKKGRSLLFL